MRAARRSLPSFAAFTLCSGGAAVRSVGHNLSEEQAYETHTKRHRGERLGALRRIAGDGRRSPRRRGHDQSDDDQADNDDGSHNHNDCAYDTDAKGAWTAQPIVRDNAQPTGPLDFGTRFGFQPERHRRYEVRRRAGPEQQQPSLRLAVRRRLHKAVSRIVQSRSSGF